VDCSIVSTINLVGKIINIYRRAKERDARSKSRSSCYRFDEGRRLLSPPFSGIPIVPDFKIKKKKKKKRERERERRKKTDPPIPRGGIPAPRAPTISTPPPTPPLPNAGSRLSIEAIDTHAIGTILVGIVGVDSSYANANAFANAKMRQKCLTTPS